MLLDVQLNYNIFNWFHSKNGKQQYIMVCFSVFICPGRSVGGGGFNLNKSGEPLDRCS